MHVSSSIEGYCIEDVLKWLFRAKLPLVLSVIAIIAVVGRRAPAEEHVETGLPRVVDFEPKTVEIGDVVTLSIENLPDLVKRANDVSKKRRLVLFLDGMPLKGAFPDPPTNPDSRKLSFRLIRSPETYDLWSHILGKPDWLSRPVTVSAGIEDEWAIPSETVDLLKISVVPKAMTLFFVSLLGAIGFALFVLACKSNVLRDASGKGEDHPLSLAKTQMACWFYLILGAFLFIGLITHDLTTGVTGSALVLLGISSATFVGATVIDSAPQSPTTPRSVWWRELISDGNGVSLHRFQMAVWTVVLGIVFVLHVYTYLAMPKFDEYLLALTGVSAGTYLGAKIPTTGSRS